MNNRKLFEDLSSSAKRKRKSKNNRETSDSVQNTLIIKKNANENIKNSKTISEVTSLDIDFEFPSIPKVVVNEKSIDFQKKLARWATNNNIKRNAFTSLLHILKDDRYPDLPYDSRTLLKTPRQIVIQDMPPGKFIYIGLKKYLENICSSLKTIPNCLEIDLNIDGAPIFNNSFENGCIWPILGRIKNLNSHVFAIAIYGGKKKPDDFNSLLKLFVEEFNDIKGNFKIREARVQLKINNIICDAPARSAICNTCGHTGLSSCPKCYIVGKRIENRSAFPYHIAQLRTNEEFRQKLDKEFHHGSCEFEKIEELDMINAFPIDYMHASLHGIMKKLLDLWFGFGTGKKPLYSASTKSRVSQKILKFVQVQPIDFQRHCRGLEQLGNWKATEFRTFALFIGPSVLENEISIEALSQFYVVSHNINNFNSQ
ncbi:hypothetical protein PVAND_005308 [Polypedilum vanderplanki]|uniref:Transposase domain-containing protein n=1 Tax=Polypedilum vanderplanki TaxID=319348 RepID=A0A9J6C0G1_POLVA|nr:hypothetical protein PVAND_005308 [Polypedilum vanderplanki]